MASSTPTKFDWPAGPESVQISGDWDNWAEKVALDRQADGSFAKEIPLAENKRVHFKFIVDGNWTTKQGAPTVDDNGNVNNIVDVGPAPKPAAAAATSTPSTDAKVAAPAAAAGVAAGAGAASAAAVSGSQSKTAAEPAQPIKEVADGDVRNLIPSSLSSITHAAVPTLTNAVAANVTGADVFRGNPETLPVSNAEKNAVQAQAQQQPASVGAAVTDASKAPTDNAKAGANAATLGAVANKQDAPAVAVNEAGFASNVDGARLASGKQGGEAAGAIASVNHSTAAAPASNTTSAAAPTTNGAQLVKEAEKTLPTTPKKEKASNPLDSAKPAAASAAVVPAAAAAAAAPAQTPTSAPAAASAPSAGQQTQGKTPISQTAGTTPEPLAAAPIAPSTPTKKTNPSGTIRDKTRDSSRHVSEASAADSERGGKRKGFFGKIKSALSPHSSPSKN